MHHLPKCHCPSGSKPAIPACGDVLMLFVQALVQRFQTRGNIPVFLLTSQVGGLGLTLTAADRVIIVDPAWNPSTDNQSVDRAYRIGQSKDVVVSCLSFTQRNKTHFVPLAPAAVCTSLFLPADQITSTMQPD